MSSDKKKNLEDLWTAISALTVNVADLKTSLELSQQTLAAAQTNLLATIGTMQKDFEEVKKSLAVVTQENVQLKKEVKILGIMVNQTRQERLNNNMLIRGLHEAEKNQEDLELITTLCIGKVNPLLNANKILRISRIGAKVDGKTRPILVEFNHSSARDDTIAKKKQQKFNGGDITWQYGDLGADQIFFDEHLTKDNVNIFARARGLKKLGFKYIWVKRGRILGRLNDGGKVVHFWSGDCVSSAEKNLLTVQEAKRRASSSPNGAKGGTIADPDLSPVFEEVNLFGKHTMVKIPRKY